MRDDDPLALPDDSVPYAGVPIHLDKPLRQWIFGRLAAENLLGEIADTPASRKVALRLRLDSGRENYVTAILSVPAAELLRVVNAIFQVAPELVGSWQAIEEIEETLAFAGSAYRFDQDARQLVRRVDDTATAAHSRAVQSIATDAADHLKAAWLSAYGVDPDPDQAYDEAVRAVEAVACPLLCPNADGRRTLGTAIGVLKNDINANAPKWHLMLPGASGNPADVGKLVGMLNLLWEGQVSRHAGSTKSRRQNQSEAEAAVQLAVLLTQWLATGVLHLKP